MRWSTHRRAQSVICHRRAHTAALTRADPYTTLPNCLPPCPAGTIVYMPKELLLSGRMTPATDIYSFGLMSEWDVHLLAIDVPLTCEQIALSWLHGMPSCPPCRALSCIPMLVSCLPLPARLATTAGSK
jgi:serine/threonine protein kinase